MGKTLYVGGLSYNTTEDSLLAAFSEAGKIESVKVITDRMTGRSRGFAFVDVAEEDMQKVIDAWNGKEFEGRTISVNEARPREERPPRRNFGGGGRGGFSRGGQGGGGRYDNEAA